MKTNFGFWRRLALVFLAIVILAGAYVVTIVLSFDSSRSAVEETRAALRKAGFKTDLAEFNFTVPSSERGFDLALSSLVSYAGARSFEPAILMSAVSSNSAVVVWEEEMVKCGGEGVPWPEFAASVATEQLRYLSARSEALARPIRFNLDASRGLSMLLPHLAAMKNVGLAFSSGMMLDLHEHDLDDGWTNLLAVTRLVTAWEPDTDEVSQIVHCGMVTFAYETTWQALQTNAWTEAQLAQLAHEWEGMNFFKDLPEVVAFQRACVVDACERFHKEPLPVTISDLFKDIVGEPSLAPRILKGYWSQIQYRSRGSYEDEKALLLFYRDREVETRNAVQAPTWAAMRSMPGVTNRVPFRSKYSSPIQSLLNMRTMSSSMMMEGTTFLGRVAEAEARRRIVLTAIALERFRIRHGNYPADLRALTPEFLSQPATDFMDGQPLRYQLGNDGHFVMYSTGLDCVDDGGMISRRGGASFRSIRPSRPSVPLQNADIVWPRVASTDELTALHEQQLAQQQQELERTTEDESSFYWSRSARRQSKVENTLASPPTVASDINYKGRPLTEILRNQNVSGTNSLTLAEMLTLRPVVTGAEPETITFDVPINFDALAKVGTLELYLDSIEGDDSDEGCGVGQMDCSRGTNGDCVVTWNTIFETPGKHALILGLRIGAPVQPHRDVMGPVFTAVVTNLCQFSLASATFEKGVGATLRARLPEMKADYSVDILSESGEHIKTLGGSTSNGLINVFWDLIDDHGKKLSDESFNTVFHLTLPESGRSQTLRGP